MRKNSLIGEVSAEFAGTAILILFGCGVVAQVVAGGESLGDHDSIAWAWGIGVTMGVYVAARLSGAHLNPAVTVALATYKGFEWAKVGPFIAAQTAGAFVAALIVRFGYTDLIAAVDPDHTYATQGIFSTSPTEGVSVTNAFFDQIIGTAILVFVIFALIHLKNDGPAANLGPFIIGLVVVGIGMAWGANAGYAINPARDFGPRLASFVTGYSDAFRSATGDNPIYFWVPIIGPLLGGVIGGGLFQGLIARNLPPEEQIEHTEGVSNA